MSNVFNVRIAGCMLGVCMTCTFAKDRHSEFNMILDMCVRVKERQGGREGGR